MKRKKLLEFANWLANGRRTFNMSCSCDCVAGQAAQWLAPKGTRHNVDANARTLRNAFELTEEQAEEIYTTSLSKLKKDGLGERVALDGQFGRRVAVAMLRFLAATGKVDWWRAERTEQSKGFRLKAKA